MTAVLGGLDHEHERDVGLVTRYQSGDTSAFADLYRLYYPRLVRFCRRHVRDEHTAEEVAQDAFLRAYQALPRFTGERRFYPWLTVIARRLVIDHYRRHGRVQPEAELDAGTSRAAEDVVVARSEHAELLEALRRVRGRHQEVLRLRDWEGLSYEDIAHRLDSPATTVPPLLHRARAALRREYLAMHDLERSAALTPLLGLLAPLRRLRDRTMQLAAWLPEPTSLCAPLAGTALAIAALFPGDTVPDVAAGAVPGGGSGLAAPADGIAAVPATAADGHRARGGAVTSASAVPQQRADIGVARMGLSDPHGVQRLRDDRHDDLVHIDAGVAGVSWDPDEDRRRLEEQVGGLP